MKNTKHNLYQEKLDHLTDLEKKINPPSPILTEADHLKAHVNYSFESLYPHFFYINHLLNYALKKPEEQNMAEADLIKIQNNAKKSMDFLFDLMNEETLPPWEKIIPQSYFDIISSGLKCHHDGNCTSFACSCERCHAEQIYKIDSTVTWGKSEGSQMLSEYYALKADKNKLEQATLLQEQLNEQSLLSNNKKNKI